MRDGQKNILFSLLTPAMSPGTVCPAFPDLRNAKEVLGILQSAGLAPPF